MTPPHILTTLLINYDRVVSLHQNHNYKDSLIIIQNSIQIIELCEDGKEEKSQPDLECCYNVFHLLNILSSVKLLNMSEEDIDWAEISSMLEAVFRFKPLLASFVYICSKFCNILQQTNNFQMSRILLTLQMYANMMLKANKHNEDFYAKQKLCIRYSSNLHNLSQLNDELQYLMRLFEVSANQFEGTVLRSEDNCSHFNGLLYNLQIVEEYELPSEISDLKDAQNLFKLIRQKLTFMAHCLRQNKWNRSSINRDDVQIMYWKYWVGLQHHCLASFQEDTDDRIKSLRKASDHWNRLKSQLIPRLKFGDPNPNPAFIYKSMHIKNIKNYQDLLRIFKNKMVALTTVDQYDKNYINLLRSDYIILIQNLLEFISHCEDIKLTEISYYYYQLALSNLSILSDDKDILIQHSRNAVLHLNELVKILNNCKESQKLFQFATDSDGKFSIGTFVQIINEDPFIKKFRLLPNKSK